jgi:hypothetical protein
MSRRIPVFSNLPEAVEGCLRHAQKRDPQLSIERFADRLGETKWTIYKWLQTGAIPLGKLIAFEHACGVHYVTRYLNAASGALSIPFPTGRLPDAGDINAVQAACSDAVNSLVMYAASKLDAKATEAVLTAAMEQLAAERAHAQTAHQPELPL